nr:glycosyltransferase [Ornithinimicrobium cryptoxanthini]
MTPECEVVVESEPIASVVVPTYRGEHRLPTLLEALANQDVKESFEVVVVVDGEVDSSQSVLRAYSDRLNIVEILRPESGGVVAALNDGFAAAKGRVLIRCDDDLTPGPDFVRRHVAWHDPGSLRAVIGPTRDVFTDSTYARAYGRPANERALAGVYARPANHRWIHWAANNSLLATTLARTGPYNPAFAFGEDFEMGWRLNEHGVEFVIDPHLEVEHRGPAPSATVRVPRAFVSGASHAYFAQHHPSFRQPLQVTSVWGRATSATARVIRTRTAFTRLGALIDRALPLFPTPAASKLVAFAVESAGRAGARSIDDVPLSAHQDAYALQRKEEVRAHRPTRWGRGSTLP